jgi:hypothetical protein
MKTNQPTRFRRHQIQDGVKFVRLTKLGRIFKFFLLLNKSTFSCPNFFAIRNLPKIGTVYIKLFYIPSTSSLQRKVLKYFFFFADCSPALFVFYEEQQKNKNNFEMFDFC